MFKLNNVRFLKALTMSVLLVKGGIGVDDNKSKDKTLTGCSTTLGGAGTNPSSMIGLVKQHLHNIDQRTINRQNILRSPTIIDLSYKPFGNVRIFLDNALYYKVKAKLTVNDISQAELDELLTKYSDAIEELDWSYRPVSISDSSDFDGDTGTPWQNTATGDTDDDEDDEEEETTPTGFPGDGWDNHIDGRGIAIPAPRRAVARMRNPLELRDLAEHPGQEANLVPRNKIILEPIAVNALAVAANGSSSEGKGNNGASNWRVTLVQHENSNFNTSSIEASRGVQAHALVKMFCRRNAAAVRP